MLGAAGHGLRHGRAHAPPVNHGEEEKKEIGGRREEELSRAVGV